MRMIAGCSNYAVDNKGNVFNTSTGRKMKHRHNHEGYAYVHIVSDNGESKQFLVRRLVATAYCNTKSGCATVILKKKFRSNKPSEAKRFVWGTRADRRVHRKQVPGKLEGHETQIIRYLNRGWTQARIAKKYGVSQPAISLFLKRNGVK